MSAWRRRARGRLRWQLTLSHLIAIAVTLVSMVAAAVLIVVAGITLHSGPSSEPVDGARTVAQATSGLVAHAAPSQLDDVLRALADGSLRLPAAGWSTGPPWSQRMQAPGPLPDVAWIAVITPNGQLLGSSDVAGAAFVPPDGGAWQAIARAALAGRQSTKALEVLPTKQDAAAYGAYPVLDAQNAPLAAVVVGQTQLPATSTVVTFWHTLAIFGAATVAVLTAASLFALISSAVVAYLLSRRLVVPIEQLSRAAASFASGDLSVQVPAGRPDEVGELARQFNRMVSDLARTLHDLAGERDRIARVLENRRQLVIGVSHELRTPITTVRGYLESALRDPESLPSALRADLEAMERELLRLQAQIDDLFTISRADVGRLELRLEPVDAGTIVRGVTGIFTPLAWRQRRVQVLAEVGDGIPAVRADARRVEQIVSNLLSNAVHHTPPGGLVAAAVGVEPDAVRLEIRDTGEGIAPEDLPHVFERFYRGSGDGLEGVGLGLTLVKDLTEAMGGSVAVTSAAGAGSCFTVRLPRV